MNTGNSTVPKIKKKEINLHSLLQQLLLSPLNLLFQCTSPVLAEPRHLSHVDGSELVDILAICPALGQRFGGHGEAHVAWAVDEFEDGRGCLVRFSRLDAQYAGVAAGAVEVAFTEGAEEFGEEGVGGLVGILVSKDELFKVLFFVLFHDAGFCRFPNAFL